MAGMALSAADKIAMAEGYKAGETAVSLGTLFGVSYTTILKTLRGMGVEIRQASQPRKLPYEEVARKYTEGANMKQLASEFGASVPTIHRIVKMYGIKAHPRVSGEAHPLWKGGTYKGADGYVCLADGRRLHRVLGEEKLGRPLLPWEDVHHADENRVNNALDNLLVMPRREHNRFHTFLRHRSAAASLELLRKLCREETISYFRFTTTDLDLARLQWPCPKDSATPRKCRVSGCNEPRQGRQMCSRHYQRYRARKRGFWTSGGGRIATFRG